MSLQALQTAFGLLVSGSPATDAGQAAGLSDEEQQQLDGVAEQRGLATVRMLYQSWRLTKVLTLLPLTIEMLGDQAPVLLTEFWRHRPARGPYFVEECLALLHFIDERAGTFGASLRDVMAFERARLEMREAVSGGREHVSALVELDHDAAAVFRAARAGDASAELPAGPTTLRGDLWADGTERWAVVGGGATASL
jgi:hypothetical protein